MSDDFGPWSVVRASIHHDTSGRDWPLLLLPNGVWLNARTGAEFQRDDFDVVEELSTPARPIFDVTVSDTSNPHFYHAWCRCASCVAESNRRIP